MLPPFPNVVSSEPSGLSRPRVADRLCAVTASDQDLAVGLDSGAGVEVRPGQRGGPGGAEGRIECKVGVESHRETG